MSFDASQLYQSSLWADNEAVHELFSHMRKEAPIHLCKHPDFPDLWHITKHADIFEVERRGEDFLNEPRLTIMSTAQEDKVRAQTGGSLNRIRSLVTYDAPEHYKLRRLTQSWFMPKNLGALQSRIDESIERAFEKTAAFHGSFDFASDIAVEYPLRVIMTVLGLPEEDYEMMLRLTQELFGPEDPDAGRKVEDGVDPDHALAQTVAELFGYFGKLTEEKMKNPKDDVASIIANAVIDGEPLDQMAKLGYYIIVATAGHDTTSYSLTEAVHQLATSPELLKRLKDDPETVAPMITEEAIRYASAVRHFVRTASADVELSGQTIKAGDSVILWYPSGSRDEDVFEAPHTFDIDRNFDIRHAAFGHGAHMCLGMHLARQEITSFLIALAGKVDDLNLAGAPKYVQANFVGGIKSLPVHMTLSDTVSGS